ncbi:MAG: DNA-binding protein WhiA [Bacilli bacterium]|nr:DNA-binding protein WhiA [Bacilli bacterium]
MSFTANIKNEIINLEYHETELIAELSAIINISAKIKREKIDIYIENIGVSRRIYKILKDLFQAEITLEKEKINRLNKNYLIHIEIKDKEKKILKALCIINEEGKRLYIPKNYICDSLEEKKSYLRGAFLICGSLNDPSTSRYHLEFIIENKKTAEYISKILNELNYNSKVLKREKNYMVYIKESEKISDFIKLLNAYNSLFYYEDIRIYRDHKNMTNRLNNCEQANIDKIVFSSNEQLENIKKLKEIKDFELLDDKIKEICIYKEKYPESSMQELANIISIETNKKITKSGINHRFRKIKEIISKSE